MLGVALEGGGAKGAFHVGAIKKNTLKSNKVI